MLPDRVTLGKGGSSHPQDNLAHTPIGIFRFEDAQRDAPGELPYVIAIGVRHRRLRRQGGFQIRLMMGESYGGIGQMAS